MGSCLSGYPPEFDNDFLYFYAYDSYDLTADLKSDLTRDVDPETGMPGFQLSYSVAWTGDQMMAHEGSSFAAGSDASNQMQYPNAPTDQTMLTACTYHATTAGAATCPVIFISGTVKPVDAHKFFNYGWNVANH